MTLSIDGRLSELIANSCSWNLYKRGNNACSSNCERWKNRYNCWPPVLCKNQSFIKAGKLIVGDELLDVNGNVLLVENFNVELTDEPVKVYNFEVEDFHTYHVGEFRILVHNADYKITLSREKYPESAKHIEDAIKNGQSRELTINRSGAKSNRKASLKGISKVPGKDLDEYPFAMCKEGGKGAHVRAIKRSDNRGSGSFIGHKLRGLPDGATFEIIIVD